MHHDGSLEGLAIDYVARSLTLTLRLPISSHQDIERRARVVVEGLVFCSIEPPWDGDGDYEAAPDGGLVLDAGEGPAKDATRLPPLPAGVFLQHFYVQSWNWRSMHIAARDARFEWIGEPTPRSEAGAIFFPGEDLPDPK